MPFIDCHLPITAAIQMPPASVQGLIRTTAPMQNFTDTSLAACVNSALNSSSPRISSRNPPCRHGPAVSNLEQQLLLTSEAGDHFPNSNMHSMEQEDIVNLNLMLGVVDPMQVDGELLFSDSAPMFTLPMEVPVTFDSSASVAPKDTVGERHQSVDEAMASDHDKSK